MGFSMATFDLRNIHSHLLDTSAEKLRHTQNIDEFLAALPRNENAFNVYLDGLKNKLEKSLPEKLLHYLHTHTDKRPQMLAGIQSDLGGNKYEAFSNLVVGAITMVSASMESEALKLRQPNGSIALPAKNIPQAIEKSRGEFTLEQIRKRLSEIASESLCQQIKSNGRT